MNKIVFPLQASMSGPSVGDLQDALRLLLDQEGRKRCQEPFA